MLKIFIILFCMVSTTYQASGMQKPPPSPRYSFEDIARKFERGEWPDVNKLYQGWTLLHWAAFMGKLDLVKKLITAQATINLSNDTQQTALDLALTAENTALVKLLRDHGGKTFNEIAA